MPSQCTSPIRNGTVGAGGADEAVFPKRLDAVDFEIRAEAAAGFVEREAGKPSGDFGERGGAEERRAGRIGVVGEAAGRVLG